MAVFIGSCNVPNSIVENAEFKSLIQVLDSRYPLPGRRLIGKELDSLIHENYTNNHILHLVLLHNAVLSNLTQNDSMYLKM